MPAKSKSSHREASHRRAKTERQGISSVEDYSVLRQLLSEGGTVAAINASRHGLPATLLISLAAHYRISRQRACSLVGIAPTTVNRKIRNKEHLSSETSERLVRIAQIEAEAIDTLGSEELAHRWLETPAFGLDGERPLEMTDTGYGADASLRILAAIRYGNAV